jgi:hypothetical protein
MKAAPVLGSLSLAFLFANPQVLIFAVLEAADKIFAVDHDVAHRAIVLIAHARAALLMQQMKGDLFALSRGMDPDGDRH